MNNGIKRILYNEDIRHQYEYISTGIIDENLKVLMDALMDNEKETYMMIFQGVDQYKTSSLMSIANNVFINMLLNNYRFNLEDDIYKGIKLLQQYEIGYSEQLCSEHDMKDDIYKIAYKCSMKRILILDNILKFDIIKNKKIHI